MTHPGTVLKGFGLYSAIAAYGEIQLTEITLFGKKKTLTGLSRTCG